MKQDPTYFAHLSIHQNFVYEAWSYELDNLDDSECLINFDYENKFSKHLGRFTGRFSYKDFLELFFQDYDLIYKEKYYTYTPNQHEIILKKVLYDDEIWKYLVTKNV